MARLLQRRVVAVSGKASDVEFVVGREISAALARAAKVAAVGGITPKELGKLREVALADGTITDDERMFLAGLLQADNAAAVATMSVTPASAITFSAQSIRPHMAEVRDFGRATPDPEVTKELRAAYNEYLENFNPHMRAARDAAIKQIHALTGSTWRRQADAVIALSTLWAGETLTAMLAAASDSTPGDMVMAGAVYIVAAQAAHPLAGDIKAGRIKVDQLPGPAKGDDFAHYVAFGGGEQGDKGDTIYVYSDLDVHNLAHRRAIIHELEHALDDKSTDAGHWRPAKHDQAEIRAYRAGSKYALEQIAALRDRVEFGRSDGRGEGADGSRAGAAKRHRRAGGPGPSDPPHRAGARGASQPVPLRDARGERELRGARRPAGEQHAAGSLAPRSRSGS